VKFTLVCVNSKKPQSAVQVTCDFVSLNDYCRNLFSVSNDWQYSCWMTLNCIPASKRLKSRNILWNWPTIRHHNCKSTSASGGLYPSNPLPGFRPWIPLGDYCPQTPCSLPCHFPNYASTYVTNGVTPIWNTLPNRPSVVMADSINSFKSCLGNFWSLHEFIGRICYTGSPSNVQKYKKLSFRVIVVIWVYAISIVFSNSRKKRLLSLLPMIVLDLSCFVFTVLTRATLC